MSSSNKSNIIRQEWRRILSKSDDPMDTVPLKETFLQKLILNGFERSKVSKLLDSSISKPPSSDQNIFYFTSPFFGDHFNRKISKILNHTGLNIRLAHRGRSLTTITQHLLNDPQQPSCRLPKCSLSNQICLDSRLVYVLNCAGCNATYIGSTYRPLHLRIKEHINIKSSPIHRHTLTCKSTWTTNIIAREHNIINLRIKEALLIAINKPTLNTKEDFQSSTFVIF
jgi:hypothetical protein